MKTILLSASLLLLFSCKKEVSTSPEVKNQTDAFSSFVKSGRFQLVAFYSDVPIDYNPSDATPKQTDHWKYVRPHVMDDHLQFTSDNSVKITQNAVKHATMSAEDLIRPYSIGVHKNKTIFNFVDYEYAPLQYQLHQQTATSFTVFVNRDNAKLFSKFEIIQ